MKNDQPVRAVRRQWKRKCLLIFLFLVLAGASVILILSLRPTSLALAGVLKRVSPCEEANVTVVSAFFDIGAHQKGSTAVRHPKAYYDWSRSWSHIHTPLIFYTDSKTFSDHMTRLRSGLDPSLTHVILINRDSLWPFCLRDAIARLYATPGYPKHHPNTVLPEYSCVQHSKYACLLDAILKRRDLVTSRVYAWVDVGYFRDLAEKDYCMVLPPNFDPQRVSFNQVFLPDFKRSPRDIHYGNHVWVGGGAFIGERDTVVTLCTEYHRATEFLLFKRNLSSTDQQCLYASFTEEGRRSIEFGVELNVGNGTHGWFDLGESCLHMIGNQSYPIDKLSYG